MHIADITRLAQRAWDATKSDEDPTFQGAAHTGLLVTAARSIVETGSAGIQGLELFERYILAAIENEDIDTLVVPEPVLGAEFLAAAKVRREEFAASEAELLATETDRLEKEAAAKRAEEADAAAAKLAEVDAVIAEETGGPAQLSPADTSTDELPENFPGRAALEADGFTSLSAIRALDPAELTNIPGIGKATAAAIVEALKEV